MIFSSMVCSLRSLLGWGCSIALPRDGFEDVLSHRLRAQAEILQHGIAWSGCAEGVDAERVVRGDFLPPLGRAGLDADGQRCTPECWTSWDELLAPWHRDDSGGYPALVQQGCSFEGQRDLRTGGDEIDGRVLGLTNHARTVSGQEID